MQERAYHHGVKRHGTQSQDLRERVLEALPLLDGETVDHKLLGLRKADSILQRLPSAFFRSPTSSFTDASQRRETAPETVGSPTEDCTKASVRERFATLKRKNVT